MYVANRYVQVEMKFPLVLAFVLSLSSCSQSLELSAYPFSAVLKQDGNGVPLYTLYWNFSVANEDITFAVKVSTTGWVGLGISPNGGMTGSDVVIGWVNADGKAFINDRYADEQALPPIDKQQDWTFLEGEGHSNAEVDGYTILQFKRKWVTCDERDRDIEANTVRLVYAYGTADPANDDAVNGPQYHATNRGTQNLNLLFGVTNPQPEQPGTVNSFVINVPPTTIPSSDTTYWCAALELPQEVMEQERYIIRYTPRITPNDFQYVHHMLIYLCTSLNETEVNATGPCDSNMGETASECRGGTILAAWAVGGSDFIYPDDVTYPLGGPNGGRYVVIEMHYDNPQMRSGVMDQSGIELFYIDQPRTHAAGILTLGHAVNRIMIVPPAVDDYTVLGLCSSQCTQEFFPEGGIKIFANTLHTHLVGRGVTLRLIRRTQECDNKLQELKPVEQNLQYDFNFQQTNVLPQEITVLPGDILLVECDYSTTGTNGVVLGGESTRDEMCLSFPVYYPRINMTTCLSLPNIYNPVNGFSLFLNKYVPSPSDQAALVAALGSSREEFKATIDRVVNWTPQAVRDFEGLINNNSVYAFCGGSSGFESFPLPRAAPDISCPYTAPKKCPTTSKAISPSTVGSLMIIIGLIACLLTLP